MMSTSGNYKEYFYSAVDGCCVRYEIGRKLDGLPSPELYIIHLDGMQHLAIIFLVISKYIQDFFWAKQDYDDDGDLGWLGCDRQTCSGLVLGGCCILPMLYQAATMPLCHYARLTNTDRPSAFPFQPILPSALHKIMSFHGT